jgi:hypothetical protein
MKAYRMQCTSFDGFPIEDIFESIDEAISYSRECISSGCNIEEQEVPDDTFSSYENSHFILSSWPNNIESILHFN